MKKIKFILIFIFLGTVIAFGQLTKNNFPSVVPPSPNASSLSVYADYPVSHYTGVPNISIPLYEIAVDDYKLPISLSYHASGIQVAQEASWVGLGWALNVGGNISRSIKCYDDFLEYPTSYHPLPEKGYYQDKQEITNPSSSYYYGYYYDNGYMHPYLKIDAEPDIFYYSLPGASGKFILNKSGGAVLFDQSANLKVDVKTENGKVYFTLTTPDGTQYIYKDRETTEAYSASGILNGNYSNASKWDDTPDNYMTPHPALEDDYILVTPMTYTSNWYLSKIITSLKKEIVFTYQKETYYAPTQESCLNYAYMYHDPNSISSCGPTYNTQTSRSKTIHDNLRLSAITWPGGSIAFSASDREDMIGHNSYKPKKLDRLTVYDKVSNYIRGFRFDYEYFNNSNYTGTYGYVFKRLKLKKVTELNENATILNSGYQLKYFEGSMPAKNSKDTDHWGYSNGKQYGAGYYPGMYFPVIDNMGNPKRLFLSGADKSSDFEFLKIGTLNEIIYPTKGSTKFVYEENTFGNNAWSASLLQNADPVHLNVYNYYEDAHHANLPNYDQFQFTVYSYAKISITGNIESQTGKKDTDYQYGNEITNPVGRIKRISPSASTLYSFAIPDVGGWDGWETSFNRTIEITQPGVYVFEALTPPKDVTAEWTLKIENVPDNNNTIIKKGGGLRIASIQSDAETRNFQYPVGTLLVEPAISYVSTFTCMPDGNPAHNSSTTYFVRGSESIHPLSSFRNGNSIGYGQVDEITKGGKISYTFHNQAEEPYSSSYPFLPVEINYFNGFPKAVRYSSYNSSTNSYSVIKKIEYEYESTTMPAIRAFMFQKLPYQPHAYSYRIESIQKSGETTTDYTQPNNSGPIEKQQSFAYNSYKQLSSEWMSLEHAWYETKIFYPTDFDDNTSKAMVNSFMIGTPVEVLSLKNDLVVSAQKTEYKDTLGMFLPKIQYALQATTPLSKSSYKNYYNPELYYDVYNSYGKPVQVRNAGNTVTYLWSYKSMYPIAEIQNATYSQVEDILTSALVSRVASADTPAANDLTAIKDLRTNADLSKAMVIVYEYKPLVGISKMTDPRGIVTDYVYDSFGRLEQVLVDGKKEMEYKYHYKE